MTEETDEEKYQKLFDYWEDLPIIKESSPEAFRIIATHEYRKAIVQVLRTGIYDDAYEKQRHALSMKEIGKEVASILDRKSLPKSTLYHHKDILEDKGIITEVTTILEGKRHVTYYGRTARGFLSNQMSTEKREEHDKYLMNILKLLNPDEDEETINKLVSNLFDIKVKQFSQVKEWMEDHSDLLKDHDIDVIVLYELLLNNYPLTNQEKVYERQLQQYLDLI